MNKQIIANLKKILLNLKHKKFSLINIYPEDVYDFKDLQESLKVSPDQAYVLNYLAYSWIEKKMNIKKSLKMLKQADSLKKDDPYITDSLGWAHFMNKNYNEAEKYLQRAVILMPYDPVINDHYADVLWKNGNKIQARYYWNYVLSLKKTEEEVKKKLKKN